ncbi:MAG: sugar ABC transporter substrate-binding protein [Chloroflexi bacterium]|nr:sugar ABC transporter substrate-binding protein [Chloroflexota bacterium]
MAQGYDAIATIAGDAGVAPFIDAAVEAGIPVATFNSETDAENKRLFFVGADLYLQGQTAARAMADAIGGEGKVAIITGFFAVEAHELRRTGFVDTLAAEFPNIEIVGEVENTDQGDIAFTQAQDFMAANPDLKGIYVTAGGPFGAAAAVEDAGKTGEVQVVSFDFVDETMEYVQKGVIYATIGQNPYAQGHDPAVRLFNYLVAGEVPPCASRPAPVSLPRLLLSLRITLNSTGNRRSKTIQHPLSPEFKGEGGKGKVLHHSLNSGRGRGRGQNFNMICRGTACCAPTTRQMFIYSPIDWQKRFWFDG